MVELVVLGVGLVLGGTSAYAIGAVLALRKRITAAELTAAGSRNMIDSLDKALDSQSDHLDSLDRDCARFADRLGMSRDGGAG